MCQPERYASARGTTTTQEANGCRDRAQHWRRGGDRRCRVRHQPRMAPHYQLSPPIYGATASAHGPSAILIFDFTGDSRLLMEADFACCGTSSSHQETTMPQP